VHVAHTKSLPSLLFFNHTVDSGGHHPLRRAKKGFLLIYWVRLACRHL